MNAAVRAAKRAKQWAIVAAREADRLLQEARKQADSEQRRRRLKLTLLRTGRVLTAAARAALIAAVATGIAAARDEFSVRKRPRGRER
jgi:hypothetical protein